MVKLGAFGDLESLKAKAEEEERLKREEVHTKLAAREKEAGIRPSDFESYEEYEQAVKAKKVQEVEKEIGAPFDKMMGAIAEDHLKKRKISKLQNEIKQLQTLLDPLHPEENSPLVTKYRQQISKIQKKIADLENEESGKAPQKTYELIIDKTPTVAANPKAGAKKSPETKSTMESKSKEKLIEEMHEEAEVIEQNAHVREKRVLAERAPDLLSLHLRLKLLKEEIASASKTEKAILQKEIALLEKEIQDLEIVGEIFDRTIPELVIHGDKNKTYTSLEAENPDEQVETNRTYKKEKKTGFKPTTDIDGLASVTLFNVAGVQYNSINFQPKGQSVEGAVNLDVGGVDGLAVIETKEGKYTIKIDNHGDRKKGKPSSAFAVYEVLEQIGKIDDKKIRTAGWTRPRLEQFIYYVNQIDSLNYPITRKDFMEKWSRTVYGLAKSIPSIMPYAVLEGIFKEGQDPTKELYKWYPVDESKIDTKLTKKEKETQRKILREEIQKKQLAEVRSFIDSLPNVKEYVTRSLSTDPKLKITPTAQEIEEAMDKLAKKIFDAAENTQNRVRESVDGETRIVKRMKAKGIKDSDPKLGKIIFDESGADKASGLKLGVIAAKCLGYDTYISWNETTNWLFISTFGEKKNDELYKKVQAVFPFVEPIIRGGIIVVDVSKMPEEFKKLTTAELIAALELGTKKVEEELPTTPTEIKTPAGVWRMKKKTPGSSLVDEDARLKLEQKRQAEIEKLEARQIEITKRRLEIMEKIKAIDLELEKAQKEKTTPVVSKETPPPPTTPEIKEENYKEYDEKQLEEEIKNNIKLMITKMQEKEPKQNPRMDERDFSFTRKGDTFQMNTIISVDTGKLLYPTADITLSLQLGNKNGVLDILDSKINAGLATSQAREKIEPNLPQIIPGIKTYFENKLGKRIAEMRIVNGKLVLKYN